MLLEELVAANSSKNVIAFTHKPVLGDDAVAVENRRLIGAAIKVGFMVNLSADNPAQPDRLAELGVAPVVTVLARAYARKAVRHRFKRRRDEWAETIGEWRNRSASLPRYTPAGMRIAVCPATYSDATCKTCDACARVRDAVVGFPAPMAPGDASNPQPPLAMSPSGSPGDSVGEIQQKPARWMVMVCG